MSRNPNYTKEQELEIYQLKKKGMTHPKIAEYLKLKFHTVVNILYRKARRLAAIKYYYRNKDTIRKQQLSYRNNLKKNATNK